MSEYRKIALSGLVALACCIAGRVPLPGVTPQVAPPVKPDAAKKPRRPLFPRVEAVEPIGAKVGGNVSPDGTEIQCDLPGDLHQRNISSKGLGCCVFRSLDHAARWQNIPALLNFPEWMVQKGIEGGGYPQKVDKLIPQICKDRGLPEPLYVQVEGADHEILKLACKSGRMACVTYSRSPTGRYGGSKIAHMVSCPHADDKYLAILDNNYIGSDNYEWMTPDEAKKAGIYEWIAVLIFPGPPPPPPRNL